MRQRLVEMDTRLSSWQRFAERSRAIHRAAVLLAHSGDSWFWLIGLGILWVLGTDYWRQRAIVYGVAILVTALIVMVLKFSVRRSRPVGEWGQIYRNVDPHSFPSGHAARAAMLGVLALGSGPMWFGVLLATWAPLVGLARIALGVHYLSDVVAGMLLGVMMGILILQFT